MARPRSQLITALAGIVVACAHEQPASTKTTPASPPAASPVAPAHKAFADLAVVDVPSLRTRITPEEVAAACEQAEKDADARIAKLVAVPDEKRKWDDAFGGWEQANADYLDTVQRLTYLKLIHSDEKVRAAAAACEERSGKYLAHLGARKDVYLAMKGYLENQGRAVSLDPVDKRLIETTMLEFKNNGLELSDGDREKLVAIRARISELKSQYMANNVENADSFEISKEELKGLPDSFVSRLKKTADGKRYIVTAGLADMGTLLENAASEAARKRGYLVQTGRNAKTNIPLLQEAIALRAQAARLLGFQTHVDFVTSSRMAQSAKTVEDFLGRLRVAVIPARDALNKRMLQMKIAQTRDGNARLQEWDSDYYLNEIQKRDFAFDDEAVREYLPADRVMAGMFQVFSTLFGVKFEEVAGAETWADGVKLYSVVDAASGRLLAKFYVDLFPRAGKSGDLRSDPIGVSRETPAGFQIPLSALLVNLTPPENGKVSNLSLADVVPLFHEFGHILHYSLRAARYNSHAGNSVAFDFIEAPSLMLENFVYRPEVLALISRDPKDPSKPLPEDLVRKVRASKTSGAGVSYAWYLGLALVDFHIHTRGEKVDPDVVQHQVISEITDYPMHPDEHRIAASNLLMDGYDGGMYGYLWSEVYADDIFSRFEKEGVLNPATGKAYRDTVLARGREEPPMQLLRTFLGREPNEEAFLRISGLKAQ